MLQLCDINKSMIKKIWKDFHKMMKAGRIQKVCKLAGVNKTSSENKSQ